MTELQGFLYPHSHYRGQVKPETLLFNANLQEFAQRISYIASLETGGKLSPEEAYTRIQLLWQQLQRSQEQLGIGGSTAKSPADEGGFSP